MRVSMFALAAILVCTAAPVPAQTVIDVEGQKPTLPQVQDQSQVQPQDQVPSRTQESPQPSATGRFRFDRVDNGFLRLDIENGQIAYCSAQTVGWACQTVPVNRAALENEIALLRNEVASLKKEVAALKEPLPPRPPADLTPPSEKGADVIIKLPTHEDIARARDFVEDTWRRLVEMIMTMQKDMMRKG